LTALIRLGLALTRHLAIEGLSYNTNDDALHALPPPTHPNISAHVFSRPHTSKATPNTPLKPTTTSSQTPIPPHLPYLTHGAPILFTLSPTKPTHRLLPHARPRALQSAHARLLHVPGLLLGLAGARDGGDQGPEEPRDQEPRGRGEVVG
jgi:hypothetical protein